MALNVVRYQTAGGPAWGVVLGDRVAPIEGDFPTTRDFMQTGRDAAELPIGTVKSIIFRGKEKIRESFDIEDHQYG